jgi:hypothetical protein
MLSWRYEKLLYYLSMGAIIAYPTTDTTIIIGKLVAAFGLTQWVETVIDRDLNDYMSTLTDAIIQKNEELFNTYIKSRQESN